MMHMFLETLSNEGGVANAFRGKNTSRETRERNCPTLVREVGLESSGGSRNEVDVANYGFSKCS